MPENDDDRTRGEMPAPRYPAPYMPCSKPIACRLTRLAYIATTRYRRKRQQMMRSAGPADTDADPSPSSLGLAPCGCCVRHVGSPTDGREMSGRRPAASSHGRTWIVRRCDSRTKRSWASRARSASLGARQVFPPIPQRLPVDVAPPCCMSRGACLTCANAASQKQIRQKGSSQASQEPSSDGTL